jgi:hypothetical protein
MRKKDSLIITIVVFTCINCTTTETISNNNHGLSAETHDYKSNENPAEINPINEGFIILSDNQNKHLSPTISSTSAGPIKKKQTSTTRTLPNITTTTTCKTIYQKISTSTSKTTSTTLNRTPNNTVATVVDDSRSRRGRRLLNDPSYDTDIDTSSTNASLDDNSDVGSFLKISDEELGNQLLNMDVMADGSGFSMY